MQIVQKYTRETQIKTKSPGFEIFFKGRTQALKRKERNKE